jgi:hypothetical protein
MHMPSLTHEERAAIARANGAKSRGPVTEIGKQRSSRNAIKHGEFAEALKLMVPPHSACLANEDRQAYYRLHDAYVARFQPSGEVEMEMVRDMVDRQWKINRNKQLETAIFNRELIRQSALVESPAPELHDLDVTIAAHEALAGNKALAALRRESAQCRRDLKQLEQRFFALCKHCPAQPAPPPRPASERTQPPRPEVVENPDVAPTNVLPFPAPVRFHAPPLAPAGDGAIPEAA